MKLLTIPTYAAADDTTEALTVEQTHQPMLADNLGVVCANYDPVHANAQFQVAANGTIYYAKMKTLVPISVTNVMVTVVTAGATFTASTSYMALYNAGGNLLGQTADQATNWGGTGVKVAALAGGPYAVAAGTFWVGWWCTATTRPQFARGGVSGAVNAFLSTAQCRWLAGTTGLTSTAPATMGTVSATVNSVWVGCS